MLGIFESFYEVFLDGHQKKEMSFLPCILLSVYHSARYTGCKYSDCKRTYHISLERPKFHHSGGGAKVLQNLKFTLYYLKVIFLKLPHKVLNTHHTWVGTALPALFLETLDAALSILFWFFGLNFLQKVWLNQSF